MRRTIGLFEHWVLRRRLNLVCKTLGITPYPWQVEFVLEENPETLTNKGKGSGKTTAVILRALVLGSYIRGYFSDFVCLDPDALRSFRAMDNAYEQYRYAYAVCLKAHAIPERPLLRSPMDPWYNGRFYPKSNTAVFRQAVAEIRREHESLREAQQHDKVEI